MTDNLNEFLFIAENRAKSLASRNPRLDRNGFISAAMYGAWKSYKKYKENPLNYNCPIQHYVISAITKSLNAEIRYQNKHGRLKNIEDLDVPKIETCIVEIQDFWQWATNELNEYQKNLIELIYKDGLTKEAIAKRFNVSTRTIYRDVLEIQDKIRKRHKQCLQRTIEGLLRGDVGSMAS